MCERCDAAKQILQEWTDKQGHDRCWWFPELFAKLAEIYGVTPSKEPCLPPEEEFEGGCTKFRKEEYGKANLLQTMPPPETN